MPFITFWHRLLQHINCVQLRPQDPSINFRDAASDISGLNDLLRQKRNCNASSGKKAFIDRLLSELDRGFCRLSDLGFLLNVKIFIMFLMETVPVWLKEKFDYFADQCSEVNGNDQRFKITVFISIIKVLLNVFVLSPLDLLNLLLNIVMMLFQI